ncbi:helix-turn-helix domain-containing protein [Patescibacteria group bacterium]|nr:helix-turn-helix domain-containing protein [Patescibacteria group bacterium]MBU1970269.1 helix-turn-helix domain-containing protein [Patescibacteria group bacterium]
MHVCQQLKKLRSDLNLSQERFGARLGISGKSISAYETGRCIPTVKILSQIANVYNVNFTEMSNDNRILLNQKVCELEKCFQQLRTELTNLLSVNQVISQQ